MAELPHTGGSEWEGSQASPWLVVNGALRRIDAFSVRVVVQGRQNAPPVSCDDGHAYLVESGTGAWSGHDGAIAIASGDNASNGWLFVDADQINQIGNTIHIVDENITLRRQAGGWLEGTEVMVDLTGAPDGGSVRWDASNGIFYVA